MEERLRITDLAEEDRPREKMLNKGTAALSDAELIAILIGSGNRNETAVQLSQRILEASNNNLNELGKRSISELMKGFNGIGEAKAISIIAALELGRRRKVADVVHRAEINSVEQAAELFIAEMGDLPHEEFWVLMLNRSNKIIRKDRVAQGGIAATMVDIKLLMKKAIDHYASAIVIAHNHPSGNLKPSQNDLELTKRIKKATEIFDIALLDHIIVTQNKYLSFMEENLLE